MREIKFRAWDKKSKYMFDVRSFQSFNNDRYECMQYTGLRDRNGKEIFEGDIYRHKNQYYDKLNIVEWQQEYARFSLDSKYLDEIEVIGTIYENPDLLKEAS